MFNFTKAKIKKMGETHVQHREALTKYGGMI